MCYQEREREVSTHVPMHEHTHTHTHTHTVCIISSPQPYRMLRTVFILQMIATGDIQSRNRHQDYDSLLVLFPRDDHLAALISCQHGRTST